MAVGPEPAATVPSTGAEGTGRLMNLILFGPPGAGKGTQGALLARHFNIPRISTGDLLREAVRAGTGLGREARRFMDVGELVPDTVILGLVREALGSERAQGGFILDGFPRNVAQGEALDGILRFLHRRLDAVAVLDVPDELVIKRIAGRRSCPNCGAVHNIHFEPPRTPDRCDVCGGELVQRGDDREETVQHRLEVYRAQTEPVLAYYEQVGVPVRHVDGSGKVDEIQAQLVHALQT